MDDCWEQVMFDGHNDLEVKLWYTNSGGLLEQSELNSNNNREGRCVMIDQLTGVVQFNRFRNGQKHGNCLKYWDTGTKWVTQLNCDA